jgi:predicted kinase
MNPTVLVILGGLPSSGKTTIARELARQTAAVHLRVDTIEHALVSSGRLTGPINDLGYRVAYALAADNLRLGNTVIADSVNPIAITREAWRRIVEEAAVPFIQVEIVCSDLDEHRRRVESRVLDIPGFTGPTWQQVIEREYEPWTEADLRFDTTTLTANEAAAQVQHAIARIVPA